ncbi:hypothetical protein V3W47_12635 [Deinococcus sp. YIM 134068]|uniref:hypothetical protein n=1 Tax=Deinococcus lichenicola TaxID=3118910 RepID=UPI002F92C51A
MPHRSESGGPEVVPTYRLEVRLRPAHPGHAWAASVEGTSPQGHPLERREFGSLMDLMRFLEALATTRGLR